MLVAIDGPGGVGKSTVSRAVAARLGLAHLDTGATYRAATLAVLHAERNPSDETDVLEAVEGWDLRIDDEGRVLLGGRDVTSAIRSEAVTRAVSAVSAHPALRERLVDLQRDWVADRDGEAVVEGRDIGTVVFPGAEVKVFLTARTEVRAMRRSGDAETGGRTVEEIEEELARRDAYDSGRAASPLRPAADAVEVDTSDLDIEGVVERVMSLVRRAAGDGAGHTPI